MCSGIDRNADHGHRINDRVQRNITPGNWSTGLNQKINDRTQRNITPGHRSTGLNHRTTDRAQRKITPGHRRTGLNHRITDRAHRNTAPGHRRTELERWNKGIDHCLRRGLFSLRRCEPEVREEVMTMLPSGNEP